MGKLFLASSGFVCILSFIFYLFAMLFEWAPNSVSIDVKVWVGVFLLIAALYGTNMIAAVADQDAEDKSDSL